MEEELPIPLSDPDKFEEVFKDLIVKVRQKLFEYSLDADLAARQAEVIFLRLWDQKEDLEEDQALGFIMGEIDQLIEGKRSQTSKSPPFDLEDAWEQFTNAALNEAPEMPQFKVEGKRRKKRRRKVYLVALILILLFSTLFFIPAKPLKYHSQKGEQQTYTLTDAVEVKLNSASSVVVFEAQPEKPLTVQCKGEGFFEVKKGGSLKVLFGNGEIECVKGSFNLRERDEGWDLKCFTGEIKLYDPAGQLLTLLTPGLMYKFRKGEGLKQSFDLHIPLWKDGKLVFEAEPFDNVIAELERQYDLTIFFPTRGFPVFTGTLAIANQEESLQTFAKTYGMEYKPEGDKKGRLGIPPH